MIESPLKLRETNQTQFKDNYLKKITDISKNDINARNLLEHYKFVVSSIRESEQQIINYIESIKEIM